VWWRGTYDQILESARGYLKKNQIIFPEETHHA
jgi:hypothetical protein